MCNGSVTDGRTDTGTVGNKRRATVTPAISASELTFMCKLFHLVYQHYIVLDCHGKAYYRLSAIYYLIIVEKIEIFQHFAPQNKNKKYLRPVAHK